MRTLLVPLLIASVSCQHPVPSAKTSHEEIQAFKFIEEAEGKLLKEAEINTFASWAYESNLTETNQKISLEAQAKMDQLNLQLGKRAQKFDLGKIRNEDLLRKLKSLRLIGTAALPEDKLKKFSQLKADMAQTYSTAKINGYKDKSKKWSLEPELTEILAENRDPEELKYVWEQWREQSGRQIKEKYEDYVDYYNEAAELNGFKDASLMKVNPYESDTFMEEMEATWQGLKPLYQQFHAYVRTKLNAFYGDQVVKKDGPIPAHLLGNMWAQNWGNIGEILRPFPNKPSIDVTKEMVRQNWTANLMFKKAEDFFLSMGMDPMPDKFWEGSILEKPKDGRELTCHASAWDFYNGRDFRIKQCTRVDQNDFVTVNHEMGHVQYFLQYKQNSFLYRNGANPGFHEGVADILSLAVGTATYFQRMGLLSPDVDINDKETNINVLFDMALKRIAFLPFGYLVDKFRWDVYSGVTSVENMNCHWWKLRNEIQGLAPPSKRSHKQFDAGAKYHVAGDVGYVRYFTAFIYEFQFYRSICLSSGKYVPGDPTKQLHQCNFYGSIEAGNKMKSMLKLGASKPWKQAMRVMTGQSEMSTSALREYFAPLEEWLEEENRKAGVEVGWGVTPVEEMCHQAEPKGRKGRKQGDSGATQRNGELTAAVIAIAAIMFFR